MAIPGICGAPPCTSGCEISRTRIGHTVPVPRVAPEVYPAADHPAMASTCDMCTARSTCLITPCLAAGSICPDSSFLKRQVFTRGEHVFREGDVPGHVFAVQSGTLKSYKTGMTGVEHVVAFHMQGDLLGLEALAGRAHCFSAVALETVSVCGISISRLEALGNRFPGWLYRLLAGELVRSRSTLLILRRKEAQARLAAFLLDLSGRCRVRGQSRQEFNLGISRQDIGNHLGMSLETLCRALSFLRKSRLIDLDRRRVIIRDFDGLHALAGT
jgi:CRP/FNR family transcriptional regulator